MKNYIDKIVIIVCSTISVFSLIIAVALQTNDGPCGLFYALFGESFLLAILFIYQFRKIVKLYKLKSENVKKSIILFFVLSIFFIPFSVHLMSWISFEVDVPFIIGLILSISCVVFLTISAYLLYKTDKNIQNQAAISKSQEENKEPKVENKNLIDGYLNEKENSMENSQATETDDGVITNYDFQISRWVKILSVLLFFLAGGIMGATLSSIGARGAIWALLCQGPFLTGVFTALSRKDANKEDFDNLPELGKEKIKKTNYIFLGLSIRGILLSLLFCLIFISFSSNSSSNSTNKSAGSYAFMYRDTESGACFWVPVNWEQKSFTKDRDFIDAKFVYNGYNKCVIIYGSEDLFGSLSPEEQKGEKRSEWNNSIFTKEAIAEVNDVSVDKVSMVTYNGIQYFRFEKSSYESGISITTTNMISIRNGWIYSFSFSNTSRDYMYNDFVSLLETVVLPVK